MDGEKKEKVTLWRGSGATLGLARAKRSSQ